MVVWVNFERGSYAATWTNLGEERLHNFRNDRVDVWE